MGPVVRKPSGAQSPLIFSCLLSSFHAAGEQGKGARFLHTELLCFSQQDKQDIKQSPEPALASEAACCQTPHGAACPTMCSLGISYPIQGDTAWDAGRLWERAQGGLWALQPFLRQGEGCPMALVRNGQEKGGKGRWQGSDSKSNALGELRMCAPEMTPSWTLADISWAGCPLQGFCCDPTAPQGTVPGSGTKPCLMHQGTQQGKSSLQWALCVGFQCSLKAGLLYL